MRGLYPAKGSLEVLIHLHIRGASSKAEFSRLLRVSPETAKRTLDVLCSLGLVRMKMENQFPFRHLHELTPIGKRLVDSPLHMWPELLWTSGKRNGTKS
jgi:DNA-binding HxlR family transcriptional regulator